MKTISLCPTCYMTIPAEVVEREGKAVILKECPSHGKFEGVVEHSWAFFSWCRSNPGEIYDGHLVDVTTRCNLNCKYCYYSRGGDDIPTPLIVNECATNRGPYILTGGEPTIRQDLPDIIAQCSQMGPTYFLTNGTGLLDRKYLEECNKNVLHYSGYSGIGLSYHAEFDRFGDVIENLKSTGIKPATVFFVIDSIDQLAKVKEFAESHVGLFDVVRIKCASNVWSESKATRVFTSDVLEWFRKQGDVRIPHGGKTTYFPFWLNGVTYSVISWYDATNVDLLDISCPPTYRAQNGEVTDFVTAMLINEGMGKGWLKGKEYGPTR